MKKILAFILCAILICATPIIASAEGEPVEEDVTVSETLPSENETVAEDEKTMPEKIVSFITDNYTESSILSLAVTVVVYLFYEIKKHRSLNSSIGVLNNNAVTVAENSAKTIKSILSEAEDIANVVKEYKDEMASLLEEVRKSAEEKKNLEDTLHNVQSFLSTAKLATLELSDEIAELLLLANIPNAKKEEIYSHHLAAVKAISDAEIKEGVTDDGTEA